MENMFVLYLRQSHWLTLPAGRSVVVGITKRCAAQASHDGGPGCLRNVPGAARVREGQRVCDGPQKDRGRETLADHGRLRRRLLPGIPAERTISKGFIFGHFFRWFLGLCSTPRQCHRRSQIFTATCRFFKCRRHFIGSFSRNCPFDFLGFFEGLRAPKKPNKSKGTFSRKQTVKMTFP